MTQATHAVFLSYASQDAAAARALVAALRAAGVEVWFDQNELVGGDAWDAKIRGQIASCPLFLPVVSVATQARLEGYFLLEWKWLPMAKGLGRAKGPYKDSAKFSEDHPLVALSAACFPSLHSCELCRNWHSLCRHAFSVHGVILH